MAFKYKEIFEDLRAANDVMTSESSTLSFENAHVLFYASLIVRNLLKDTRGIQHQPLDPSDVTLEKAEELIKDEIYSFLYWILSSNSPTDNDLIDKSSIRESNNNLHRYIMSLRQDLVYMLSRGKTRTPKHIGLSVTCHKMTQSKEVIRLLNQNGQGVSYDEVQAIDTTWALQQINENHIVLPSNMNRGTFTHAAADNWNRATDAVTGEHLDIVNLVLFQSKNRTLERGFDDQENYVRPSLSKDRKRSLTSERLTTQILNCPNLKGNNVGPVHLKNRLSLEWYFQEPQSHTVMRAIDRALIFLRIGPEKIFEIQVTDEIPEDAPQQDVPGWTAFHAIISNRLSVPTNIGYCQAIPSFPSDVNTVYTVLKRAEALFRRIGQEMIILTWDEALYPKAQIIKWRNADEFENLFNRMGGFHRATNYMGDIGTIMEGSGFEDCLVESGIYSNAVISKINRGKAYNRGMRAHKLLFEALSRLKWKAFIDWIEENNVNVDDIDKEQVKNAVIAVQNLMKDAFNSEDEFRTAFEHLKVTLRPVTQILERFERNCRNRSDTYVFWDNYLEIVQLLLEYVASEREISNHTLMHLPICYLMISLAIT